MVIDLNLQPAQRRYLAIFLLAAILAVLAYLLVVSATGWLKYRTQLATIVAESARYESALADFPRLTRRGEGLERALASTAVTARTAPGAMQELRGQILSALDRAGIKDAKIDGSISRTPDPLLTTIHLTIRARADLTQLRNALYQIETARPQIFVAAMSLGTLEHSIDQLKTVNGPHKLAVTFTLTRFVRAP